MLITQSKREAKQKEAGDLPSLLWRECRRMDPADLNSLNHCFFSGNLLVTKVIENA